MNDTAKQIANQVFQTKEGWRVTFRDEIMRPRFKFKEQAYTFLEALKEEHKRLTETKKGN